VIIGPAIIGGLCRMKKFRKICAHYWKKRRGKGENPRES
jgi:hypothetical protein